MAFTFREATRENVGLILGVIGPSGAGKTFSAMRLAKGMAGGKRFAVIDTENGRAKHYADQFEFDHGDLHAPFSPERYQEAILAADTAGYSVIVVDSASHEHAGDGGILDMQEAELVRMAGDDYRKRESCKMAAWIKPKTAHKRMMTKLLQVRAHLILCFRAEEKIEMVKGADGKLVIQPKKSLTGLSGWIPICEKTFPYELTASFLLTPEKPGVPQPIKLQEQHRALVSLAQPLDEKAGAELAAWARGGETSKNVTAPNEAQPQGGRVEVRDSGSAAASPRPAAKVRFGINGKKYETAGATRAQFLEMFRACEDYDLHFGELAAVKLLMDTFPGKKSRSQLTASEAADYLVALRIALEPSPEEQVSE